MYISNKGLLDKIPFNFQSHLNFEEIANTGWASLWGFRRIERSEVNWPFKRIKFATSTSNDLADRDVSDVFFTDNYHNVVSKSLKERKTVYYTDIEGFEESPLNYNCDECNPGNTPIVFMGIRALESHDICKKDREPFSESVTIFDMISYAEQWQLIASNPMEYVNNESAYFMPFFALNDKVVTYEDDHITEQDLGGVELKPKHRDRAVDNWFVNDNIVIHGKITSFNYVNNIVSEGEELVIMLYDDKFETTNEDKKLVGMFVVSNYGYYFNNFLSGLAEYCGPRLVELATYMRNSLNVVEYGDTNEGDFFLQVRELSLGDSALFDCAYALRRAIHIAEYREYNSTRVGVKDPNDSLYYIDTTTNKDVPDSVNFDTPMKIMGIPNKLYLAELANRYSILHDHLLTVQIIDMKHSVSSHSKQQYAKVLIHSFVADALKRLDDLNKEIAPYFDSEKYDQNIIWLHHSVEIQEMVLLHHIINNLCILDRSTNAMIFHDKEGNLKDTLFQMTKVYIPELFIRTDKLIKYILKKNPSDSGVLDDEYIVPLPCQKYINNDLILDFCYDLKALRQMYITHHPHYRKMCPIKHTDQINIPVDAKGIGVTDGVIFMPCYVSDCMEEDVFANLRLMSPIFSAKQQYNDNELIYRYLLEDKDLPTQQYDMLHP